MTARSRHIPKDEQIAALLGEHFGIPYEHRKEMSAEQVRSLFEPHHAVIPFADGGPHKHWNLAFMWRNDHKIETRTKTVPTQAKGRRLVRVNEEMQRILLKPCGHKRQRSGRIPARVNPWGKKGARKFGRGR